MIKRQRGLLTVCLLQLVLLFGILDSLQAQSVNVPLNMDLYHLADRYEVLSGQIPDQLHTGFKPAYRQTWADWLSSYPDSLLSSRADRFNLDFLTTELFDYRQNGLAIARSKSKLWRSLYAAKSAALYIDTVGIQLVINPVLHLVYGQEDHNLGEKYGQKLSTNTRGIEIRGILGKKLGFYSFIGENQLFLPSYVDRFIEQNRAVPGEGFYKPYEKTGVDFITARGYISYHPMPLLNLQFGHDKVFVGNGYRSLLLSDFSNNQLFFRANATFWKVNYVVHFSELTASTVRIGPRYPRKYLGMHHLSLNLGKKFNLSFFESIVFGGTDTLGRTTFEAKYLNPVIFYRFVEQQSGSADNAMLGMHAKWNPGKRWSLYGAVLLDEFVIREFRARQGWWGNKQAFQIGMKYFNVLGLKNLDLQTELNYIRPYTYTHFDNNNSNPSYTSYNMPLAHPLGANVQEVAGILRYQPFPRLQIQLRGFISQSGLDSGASNWGSNVRLDYRSRQKDYGNTMLQGVKSTLVFAHFQASYMIRHQLFIDLGLGYRRQEFDVFYPQFSSLLATFGIRLNVAQRLFEF